MAVKGNDLAPHEIEFVLLKKFGETLTIGALTWYSRLPEHSIDSFEMLTDSFTKAHVGARKVHARKADIFRIVQGESKLVREFVTRFQKERMFLPAVPYEWVAEAFTKGLNPRSSDTLQKFKENLLEFQATTWADVHNWRTDRGRNNQSLQDKEASGSRDPSYPKLLEYNFNASIVELVLAMRNIKEARFLKLMRSDPRQRDPNLWCEYHGTNGHRTGYYRHLWE
ncbi:uncharacterized protein [Nicotiana tomentosiformis]|uniref:uncharacterized protein n=1 Tax=Nicotiana tomentosiformis TaxID=4098 RepID=UPI00388C3DC8